VGWYLAVVAFNFSLFAAALQALVPPTPLRWVKKHVRGPQQNNAAAGPTKEVRPVYKPTTQTRYTHMFSLLFVIATIVLASCSISSDLIPWSLYDQTFVATFGVPPPAPYDSGLSVTARAGLQTWTLCIGEEYDYDPEPSQCSSGNQVLFSIAMAAVFFTIMTFFAVIIRGYNIAQGILSGVICVLTSLTSTVLFLTTFVLWMSSSTGCGEAVNRAGKYPGLTVTNSTGFALIVASFVFSFFGSSPSMLQLLLFAYSSMGKTCQDCRITARSS